MAVINVDDIYSLDNTGKQVDDAVDYALANSNRNLLDNPWFTVQQRTEKTSGSFGVNDPVADRWFTTYYDNTGSSWAYSSDGITLTIGSAGNVVLFQKNNTNIPYLTGKTVTISVLLSDGTIHSGTMIRTRGNQYVTLLQGAFNAYIRADNQFWLQAFTGANGKTIRAVKLELGSYSTLANDVPPDYGEELRKCRRYFRRYAPNQTGLALIGRAASTTEADFILGDEPMAKSTGITAAINGAVYARAGDNTSHSVTSAVVQTSIGGGPALICATTGLTLGATAVIVFASGGYIDINGDL